MQRVRQMSGLGSKGGGEYKVDEVLSRPHLYQWTGLRAPQERTERMEDRCLINEVRQGRALARRQGTERETEDDSWKVSLLSTIYRDIQPLRDWTVMFVSFRQSRYGRLSLALMQYGCNCDLANCGVLLYRSPEFQNR